MKVLIADDQGLVRGALAALLSLEDDIEVVGQAGNGIDALEIMSTTGVDVALVDIEMPGMDGFETTERIRATYPETKVIIVTTFGRTGYLRRALEAGASGFVVKETPADQLADAVRKVHAGERVVDPELATESLFDGGNPLSEREREILSIALEGAPVSRIASEVYLSEGTVRNHLSSAIQKTGSSTRIEAARKALDNGWL